MAERSLSSSACSGRRSRRPPAHDGMSALIWTAARTTFGRTAIRTLLNLGSGQHVKEISDRNSGERGFYETVTTDVCRTLSTTVRLGGWSIQEG